MSIRTDDREHLRRVQETVVHKKVNGDFYWFCSHCQYSGSWTTEGGAINKISEHLMNVHHIRLTVAPMKKPEATKEPA